MVSKSQKQQRSSIRFDHSLRIYFYPIFGLYVSGNIHCRLAFRRFRRGGINSNPGSFSYKINSDQGLCSFSLSFSPVIFKITYSGRSIPLSSYYSTAYQSDWIWSKDAQLSSTGWLRPPIPGQKRQRILDSDPPTSKK